MKKTLFFLIGIFLSGIIFCGCTGKYPTPYNPDKNKEKKEVINEKIENKKIPEEVKEIKEIKIEEGDDIYTCETDEDCISVSQSPCGCGGGGKNKAINKKFEEDYRTNFRGGICAAVMSDDPTCRIPPSCKNKKCTIDLKDIRACERLEDPRNCVAAIMKNEESLTKCDEIQKSDTKDECYSIFGQKTDNVQICEKIKSNEIKIKCKAYTFYQNATTNDEIGYEYCYNIPEESNLRQQCLFVKIQHGDDETKCDLIENEEWLTNCKSLILSTKSEESHDINFCYQIPDPGRKGQCIKEIAIYKKDIDLCREIEGYETASDVRSNCILGIAIETNDYELCRKTKGANSMGNCLYGILKKEDVDLETSLKICEMQTDKYWINESYERMAIKFKNEEFCEKTEAPDKCKKKTK